MAKRAVLLHALPHVTARIPGLKRLPVLKVLAVAEIAQVARLHLRHLDHVQRRRLAELIRRARKLSPAEREELQTLVAALEARAFAGSAVQRLSPIPLPKRLTRARY
jgi:hypothetical protein